MSGYFELPFHENLFTVFKLCCLCLFNPVGVPSEFAVTLLLLGSDRSDFMSAVRSVQSSFVGCPVFVRTNCGLPLTPIPSCRIFVHLRPFGILQDPASIQVSLLAIRSLLRQRQLPSALGLLVVQQAEVLLFQTWLLWLCPCLVLSMECRLVDRQSQRGIFSLRIRRNPHLEIEPC